MSSVALDHPAVAATLEVAADVVGMEAAFVGLLDDSSFVLARVGGPQRSSWPELVPGMPLPRAQSMCHHMLLGAAAATSNVSADPVYGNLRVARELGVTSYVGRPILAQDGAVLGTLCAIDREPVSVGASTILALAHLADVVAAILDPGEDSPVHVVRGPQGWTVRDGRRAVNDPDLLIDDQVDGGLVGAMVLADLLDETPPPAGSRVPAGHDEDEHARLRTVVSQLEHALASRVVVERAIGIVMQRQHLDARAAFTVLRTTARTHGARVHDLATAVVASVVEPGVALPAALR